MTNTLTVATTDLNYSARRRDQHRHHQLHQPDSALSRPRHSRRANSTVKLLDDALIGGSLGANRVVINGGSLEASNGPSTAGS